MHIVYMKLELTEHKSTPGIPSGFDIPIQQGEHAHVIWFRMLPAGQVSMLRQIHLPRLGSQILGGGQGMKADLRRHLHSPEWKI